MSAAEFPYPGLRAFTREESYLFFGRDGCVDAMINRLSQTHFLGVLGASGSGKSSLVRTGLLDALELGFYAEAGSRWKVIDMHPGQQPFRNLAAGLASVSADNPEHLEVEVLRAMMTQGPRSLIEWCAAGHLKPGQNLLLLVDQFEELFRYGDYSAREQAEGFVALLLESAATTEVPVHVVLTMRSEYLGACSLIPGLAEKINAGFYLTPRMTREECRQAIEGPAAVAGFVVEPALVNQLLNDMAGFAPWDEKGGVQQAQMLSRRADQLPLMQHLLNRLWLVAQMRADGGPVVLTIEDYFAAGGLAGALDAHAAQILRSLGDVSDRDLEMVFRCLISGPDPTNAVRRPCRFGELAVAAKGGAPVARRIVEAFRAADCNFLQPAAGIPLYDDTVVDISHESLIRQWSRLAEWLRSEARADANWRRLVQGAERVETHEGDLLTGLDLDSLAAWWDIEQPTPEWAIRHGGKYREASQFLADSREASLSLRIAQESRTRRERNLLLVGITALAVSLGLSATFGLKARGTSRALTATNAQLKAQKKSAEEHALYEKTLAEDATQSALAAKQSELVALQSQKDAKDKEKEAMAAEKKAKDLATTYLAAVHASQSTANARADQVGASRASIETALGQAQLLAKIDRQFSGMVSPSDQERNKASVATSLDLVGDAASALRVREQSLESGYQTLQKSNLSPAEREKLAAATLESGYLAAWECFDIGDDEKGDKLIAEMDRIAERYGPANNYASAPPVLFLPLTHYERLLSRRAIDKGNKEADKLHTARADALTQKPDAPPANKATLDRIHAMILNEDNTTPDKSTQACKIYETTYNNAKLDRTAIYDLVKCKVSAASAAQRAGKSAESDTLIAEAEKMVSDALHIEPDGPSLLLLQSSVFEGKADIALLRADTATQAKNQIAAAISFVKALHGRTIVQEQTRQVREIYDAFASINFDNLAEHKSLKEQEDFFWNVSDAVIEARKEFPRAPSYAFVSGDSTQKVAALLVKQDLDQQADDTFDEAESAFRDGKILERNTEFTEDTAAGCEAWGSRIELDSHMGLIDQAVRLYAEMQKLCGPALEKRPWDFYLRTHMTSSASALGIALADNKRYADAVSPLEFASKWGVKDSSLKLGEIYRQGGLGKPDLVKAVDYEEFGAGQSMKRFTVPVDCAGAQSPFYFYIQQLRPDIPIRGIDDQVKWLEEARGCKVSKDVIESFQKLNQIAIDNKVSFPDLAAYALDKANDDKKKPADSPATSASEVDREPNEKAAPLYTEALKLYKAQNWQQTAEVAQKALAFDPTSIKILNLLEETYHDELFRYDRAFDLNSKRVQLGDGNSDFVEKHLTTSRFEACTALAVSARNAATEKRLQIVMSAFEFACLTGERKSELAQAAGHELRAQLAGLKKVGWTFTGTEHFLNSSPAFRKNANAWVNLFEALEKGNESAALTALDALHVPK